MVDVYRILRARPYFTLCYAAGVVAWLVLPPEKRPAIRAVAAWDIGRALYVMATLLVFFISQDRDISADAKSHREGEW